MPLIEHTPDEPIHELTFGLMQNRALLRPPAAQAKHVPGNEVCEVIARQLVERFKAAGIERIPRRTSPSHAAPSPKAR